MEKRREEGNSSGEEGVKDRKKRLKREREKEREREPNPLLFYTILLDLSPFISMLRTLKQLYGYV